MPGGRDRFPVSLAVSPKQTAAKQILKFTNHEFPKSKGPFSLERFTISLRIISRPNGSTLKKSGGWQDFWVDFRLTPATLNTINPHVIIIGRETKISIIQNTVFICNL